MYNGYIFTEKQVGKYRVIVVQDTDPLNPREDWDLLTGMICWHSRYNLGDKIKNKGTVADTLLRLIKLYDGEIFNKHEKFTDANYRELNFHELNLEYLMTHFEKYYISLPLFIYEHSGITMNTTGFSCSWDSGQIGFIYIDKKKYLKEFSYKKMTKKRMEKAFSLLRDEVDVYNRFLTGEVYGYLVYDTTDDSGLDDLVDSCWGYFEDTESVLAEGVWMAEHFIKKELKNHIEKVKAWIKNKVPVQHRSALEV